MSGRSRNSGDFDASPHEARRAQWRGLAELARDPSLLEQMSREIAPEVDEAPDGATRREMLRLMGASFALAGLGACSRAPSETIRPYAIQPPDVMPGVARHYATAMTTDGYARGLLVESHEGRPTKIEGNPDHPMSLGATFAREQAAVLSLYDDDRPRTIVHRGETSTWAALRSALTVARGDGRGLHLLIEPTGSPLIADQIGRIRARFPAATVHFHGAIDRRAVWDGARIALGRPLETQIDLQNTRIIVALDADVLARGPAALRLARQFANGRRLTQASDPMNRLYAIEPSLTVTGASADHRLRLAAAHVVSFAAALLAQLVTNAADRAAETLAPELARVAQPVSMHDAWIRAVARDLAANRGRSVVLAGDDQPAVLHALVHAINAILGNVGNGVAFTESPILDAGLASHDLSHLVRALSKREVGTLVIVGGNPAYTAFADFDFFNAISTANESVYLGSHFNETARAAHWFVPEAHMLESWGDARAVDGTISIVQPLSMPRTGGRAPSEILALFLGDSGQTAHQLLIDYWRRARPELDQSAFDAWWAASLDRGIVADSAFPIAAPAAIDFAAVRSALAQYAIPSSGIEVVYRPDARIHDGALGNNAWLQELPDPLTKLTWDNAALLSPSTAQRLGIEDGDVLRLERTIDSKTRAIEIPALRAPGQADDSIAIALGYGKTGDERIARGVGVNAYAARTSLLPYVVDAVHVSKTGAKHDFAITQSHHALEGRDDAIYLQATLDVYRANPRFAAPQNAPRKSLYASSRSGAGAQWGMVIDLGACTGCSACVVACQSENNVPVVGKVGVRKQREMQWLRIDRYFIGDPDSPDALMEPMLCQHCEKAPCEYVCPVNATVHSDDGLNQMVYNRCVGTRFCSNNCAYKVRRFNWFDYQRDAPAGVSLQHNPDVTVRARGVMEKCTYCVQRIREAEIHAGAQRRNVRDGEVVPACAQACASGAITFGNTSDATSAVAKLRTNERAFGVLQELGNAPRTRYLARIRNRNPEIA